MVAVHSHAQRRSECTHSMMPFVFATSLSVPWLASLLVPSLTSLGSRFDIALGSRVAHEFLMAFMAEMNYNPYEIYDHE